MRKSYLLNSIAGAALLLSTAAQANTDPVIQTQLGDAGAATFGNYLSAHVAAGDHNMTDASTLYRAALAADPENADLINKAFLYAAASGDIRDAVGLAARVVANNPDDRAARLALAIGAIHRHDFAAARKQLSQSSQGPFTTLTLLLADTWAAQGAGDTNSALKDIGGLNKAGATDALSMYHKALILDLAGHDADAETAYQAALKADATNPRAIDAYGRFLERAGRVADARALYTQAKADDTLAPIVDAGMARLDGNQKPDRLVPDAQSGAAEGLFGIAASLTDATSADIAVLYLR
ncbi:MAG TPA: hypothetical protein VG309_10865, partial [Rhizomicrobium sp.]|nr:hypothetical protein [Rhizomicrobium sp.]